MPVTVTVDPNFIYAMLKEYNDAVLAKNIGGTTLSNVYLALLNGNTEVQRLSLNCTVVAVTGGAKIVCTGADTSSSTYTANGAAYRFERVTGTTTKTYELFRVSFPAVTKGSSDGLSVTATAVLTVG